MRTWKPATLLLIVAIAGACTSSPDAEEKTAADKGAAAPSTTAAPSAAPAPAAAAPAADKPKPAAPKAVTIPSGTTLSVTLSTALNSGKNKAGDTFAGNLSEPVTVDGKTVLDKGTAIEGKVVAAEASGKVKGKAHMSLTLTSATVGGKTVSLTTKDHSAEAESTKGRDTAVVAGGAGVGAAVGAIAGGGKGAAIGAAVGGAGGTAAVLATKGKEVDYPAETKLEFTLDKEVSVTP